MKSATTKTKATTKTQPKKAAQSESGIAITVEQGKLFPILQALSFALDTKNVIPVLSYVLFDVRDGDAYLTATNLDLYIIEKLTAVEVTGEGKFLLPLKRLLAFVQHSDGEIKITGSGDNIKVTSGNAKVNWQTLPVNAFPELPKTPDNFSAMPGAPFARALKAIEKIQRDSDVTYTFNNIFFEVTAMKIVLASSDGHRMGYAELPPVNSSKEWNVLIPKKAIPPIIRVAEGNEEVFFGHTDNHYYLNGGERRIISRLIAGKFPDFSSVVKRSDKHPIDIAINTFALRSALSRVIAACEDGKEESLRVTVKKGKMTVEIDRRQLSVGIATDAINVDYDGAPFEFGMNHKYLSDACQIADDVILKVRTPDSEMQVRVASEERILHIIMPQRLGEAKTEEKAEEKKAA